MRTLPRVSPSSPADRGLQFPLGTANGPDAGQQLLALCGQLDAPPASNEQRDAPLPFQVGDDPADRRLRIAEHIGRPGDIPKLHGFQKDFIF